MIKPASCAVTKFSTLQATPVFSARKMLAIK